MQSLEHRHSYEVLFQNFHFAAFYYWYCTFKIQMFNFFVIMIILCGIKTWQSRTMSITIYENNGILYHTNMSWKNIINIVVNHFSIIQRLLKWSRSIEVETSREISVGSCETCWEEIWIHNQTLADVFGETGQLYPSHYL